jgi:probable rRNA maturation factor
LAELGHPEAELSILFVDDVRIRELNRTYLHRDKPTNVLAFSMQEGPFSGFHPHLLGDIVISVDTAERQSGRFGLHAGEMILLLMIHGILHLLGYDHERSTKKAAREMATKQKEILRIVREQGVDMLERGCE